MLIRQQAWLDPFRAELLAFPHSAHDDQADALSQLINWTGTRSTYTLDNLQDRGLNRVGAGVRIGC